MPEATVSPRKLRLRERVEIRPGVYAFTDNRYLMHSLPPAEYEQLVREQFFEDLHAADDAAEQNRVRKLSEARESLGRSILTLFRRRQSQ